MTSIDLEKAKKEQQKYQDEIARLSKQILALEEELNKQRDQYVRKSTNKSIKQQQYDPELDRMKGYIKELEEEISEMKLQMTQA